MKVDAQNIFDVYNDKIINFNYDLISDDLIDGKIGVIVYLLSFYDDLNKEECLLKITELLEAIFENLEVNKEPNLYASSTLSSGLSGLGYIIDLLIKQEVLDHDYEVQIKSINQIVYEKTKKLIADSNFDYLNGSFGNLWYLFKVGELDYFNQLVRIIYERCLEGKNLFYTESQDPYINGMNYGLAHGCLGLIKTLIQYADLHGSNDEIEFIIHKVIGNILNFLDYNYVVNKIHIYKPYKAYLVDGAIKTHQNNRLAWCNSDLIFAYILYKAGDLYKNEEYLLLANKIALETTKRIDLETTGVENDHFCHGTSGIALLYKNIYDHTKLEAYLQSYQYWKNKTVSFLNSAIEKPFEPRDMSLLHGRLAALMVVNNEIHANKHLDFLI